jgi:5-methylcytosine-specific restriction protein A
MPNRALSQCSTPGCPGRGTHHGRCIEHAEQASRTMDLERGTSNDRGYGADWRRIRERFLRDHPGCVQCAAIDRYQQATDVDHIIPRRQGGTDDPSNLQALCHEHHSAKTMREMNRARRG